MTEVNIHEAKTRLAQLLLRVAAGEEIVIARAGKPVAKLVPLREHKRRVLGTDVGRLEIPDDFDTPLGEVTLALFER